MQITGLKIRAVNIPLIKPYTISLLGEVTTTRSVIVEIFTDQGLVGIGETDQSLIREYFDNDRSGGCHLS